MNRLNINLLLERLKNSILNVAPASFDELALEVFAYQANHCKIYNEYLMALNIKPDSIKGVSDIPFLPIQFFKYHKIVSIDFEPKKVFYSSGTTAQYTSKHYLFDEIWYKNLSAAAFENFYGPLSNFHILGLLPSYLENESSSLLHMLDHFMIKSGSGHSRFFGNDYSFFYKKLNEAVEQTDGKMVLVWGVGYALLDLLEQGFDFSNFKDKIMVLETGGMKGRRKEMIKSELHSILCAGFNVTSIHSEYGMTELLSQAYSYGQGVFKCANTMQVLLRDVNDPLTIYSNHITHKTGGINIIDLANIDTCSFIETQDLGRYLPHNQFEIIGRFDHADIRGCNLLMEKNDW